MQKQFLVTGLPEGTENALLNHPQVAGLCADCIITRVSGQISGCQILSPTAEVPTVNPLITLDEDGFALLQGELGVASLHIPNVAHLLVTHLGGEVAKPRHKLNCMQDTDKGQQLLDITCPSDVQPSQPDENPLPEQPLPPAREQRPKLRQPPSNIRSEGLDDPWWNKY